MRSLDGYSVLVTGGGSGIGAGLARYLADHGARVTISGRRADKVEAVAAAIGPSCRAIAGDVTSARDRESMIAAAVHHGDGLDGLANCAGNMLRGPITELEEADVLALLNSNVVAAMMLTGLAVPYLEKDGGSVLFFGSVHTRRAFPGASPYAASKGAIEVLSRVLAAELGPRGITVNCLLPGAVPTEINVRAGLYTEAEHLQRLKSMEPDHPLGRIGTPEEIAEAAAYLLTARWTTGAVLVVDGGLALGVSYK
jgi:NAD(P)-dependent dehydrogenase (short-subunit alcohol dehydrogenase family)